MAEAIKELIPDIKPNTEARAREKAEEIIDGEA
jgi:hypothetical protein